MQQLPTAKSLPRAFRVALALALALSSLALAPTRATAQQFTNYEAYLAQVTGFEARGASLIKQISDVAVIPKYCDDAQRREVGRRLADLFVALSTLRREWADFKAGVNKFGKTPVGISMFGPEKKNPNEPNFWAKADRHVFEHAQADLDALRERYRASKTIDCSAPSTTAAPPPPVRPKVDPLAGLTRPKLITQDIPPVPGPFCSEEERWAWYKAVVRPLMEENTNASWALREYGDKLWSRLQAATAPGKPADQSVIDALQKELRWEQAEHAKLDKIYGEKIGPLIAWLYAKEAVIDCTQKMTTPAPTATGGNASPAGKTGDDTPPVPVDTTKPRSVPKVNEPPRVGVLPGFRHHEVSVFGGYEWNSFPSFPKVVGDAPGIADADGKSSVGGSYVGVDVRVVRWRFSMCRHVSVLRYTQMLDGIDGYSQVDGRLTGSLYDLSIGRELGLGWNTYIETIGGLTLAYDELEMNPLSKNGPGSTQTRSLMTGKLTVGLSLRHALTNNMGIEAGVGLHTSGRTGQDADYERSYRIGARYGFQF